MILRYTIQSFNPRTPGGVRHRAMLLYFFCRVSIHAPRAGCDWYISEERRLIRVSIHAPRAGCDLSSNSTRWKRLCFNPRTPGGVRRRCKSALRCALRFNPRTPPGVRLLQYGRIGCHRPFQSTHPARGATTSCWAWMQVFKFQSTHPARGATHLQSGEHRIFSFNPRTPPGVRHGMTGSELTMELFQSTHPARGATLL